MTEQSETDTASGIQEDPETGVLSAPVPEDCDGNRFDRTLAIMFPEYSRSRLKAWVQSGRALLDGQSVAPKQAVSVGQQVELLPEPEEVTEAQPEPMDLDIVFEDEHLLVINKPAGLVVHPGAGNHTGTLVNGLLAYDPNLSALPRAGLIHRLDKDTSGLLIVARSLPAHTGLVRALEQREISREYRAVCLGRLTAGGTVDAPVGRHPQHRTKMAVSQTGKPAVTHYRVLMRFDHFTLVACRLESGRTHQIRVHMTHEKHPLVGDPLYTRRLVMPPGASEALQEALHGFRRQALHAFRLAFAHPVSGEDIELFADMPEDLISLLQLMSDKVSDKTSVSAADLNALRWPEQNNNN